MSQYAFGLLSHFRLSSKLISSTPSPLLSQNPTLFYALSPTSALSLAEQNGLCFHSSLLRLGFLFVFANLPEYKLKLSSLDSSSNDYLL
jgi:hypothetical protein